MVARFATGRRVPIMTKQGVGARLIRKEDDRYMRGRGEFVGDIRLPGMQDAAFVRSPLAHARIISITIPEDIRASVFTAADLEDVAPIRAVSALPGFKPSDQPVLAKEKVRRLRRADQGGSGGPYCPG
jgi:carbon-monoxide dehydrogenase large subunit